MSGTSSRSFKIHGMDCAEEVAVLKQEVGPVVGGEQALSFDILNGKMSVAGAENVSSETILQVVARSGLRAELWREGAGQDPSDSSFWSRRGRTILTAVSGGFILAGFLTHVALAASLRAALGSEAGGEAFVPVASAVLYSFAILAGAWFVLPKAWFSLRRLRPDMNLLMTVAVLGAVALGDWLEAATVAFLFALSLALESWSVGRARRAVEALLDLTPPSARLLHEDGREEELPPAQVPPRSRILVKPGERIPLDGEVASGSSAVNQAPITGESVPVQKQAGDTVFAGTINGDGALEVKTTKPAGDTTLAHIIGMVGAAQSRRAPSEQWVEHFARVYTPSVLVCAILLALVPPLLGGNWGEWFYRSLVLLVIACPCALVISTPVSIVAALAAAARNGVLIKGGLYIELAGRLKAIAFDKTGTLTEGKPKVVEVVPLNGHTEAELLERVAALEARSEHPIGAAVLLYARENGVPVRPAEDFQIIPGRGATGRFNGDVFWLGSHRYLEERKQETEEIHQRLEAMSAAGRTVVVVGNERHVCGLIAVADTLRPNARKTVEELVRGGVAHLVLLTGDNNATAQAVARDAGIKEVRSELLPEEKVKAVESLLEKYGLVAMVGDGVNDAPALARATLGVAMGAAGTDAAIETADVALMSDELSRLPWLVRHSRRTLAIIRQNIVFALGVKAVFVALTIAGYPSLWAAIAADTGASVLVIFNGLRLLRKRDD